MAAVLFPGYSSEDAVLKAKSKGVVETDIAVAVPIGYYGRVAPRSGLGKSVFICITSIVP